VTVWFTSDLHFGHEKVARMRLGELASLHDAGIADIWADQVRKGDQVWVLGDVTGSTATGKVRGAVDILRELPGEKHLVWGNHDAGHPMYRDAHRKGAQYLTVNGGAFVSAQMAARRRINGASVLLSHFPYVGDHATPGRHQEWRLRNHGSPILHGHTHSTTWLSVEPSTLPYAPQIHVGWDAWSRLVSLDEVAALLETVQTR